MFQSFNLGVRVTGAALLLSLAQGAAAIAATIYDSTGGSAALSAFDPLSPAGAGPVLADRFVAPFSGAVTSVTLDIGLNGSTPTGTFLVEIFADTGAGPGAAIGLVSLVDDSTLPATFGLQTYTTTGGPISLSAGGSYYAGVLDGGSAGNLANTTDSAVLSRPAVALGAFYYNNGGVQANSGGPYDVIVNESAALVPEPASLSLVLGGIGAIGALRRRGAR